MEKMTATRLFNETLRIREEQGAEAAYRFVKGQVDAIGEAEPERQARGAGFESGEEGRAEPAAAGWLLGNAERGETAADARRSNLLYALAAATGRADEAWTLLREAVLEHGFWYPAEYLLEDEDLEPLRGLDGFAELADLCAKREEAALMNAAPGLVVLSGAPDGAGEAGNVGSAEEATAEDAGAVNEAAQGAEEEAANLAAVNRGEEAASLAAVNRGEEVAGLAAVNRGEEVAGLAAMNRGEEAAARPLLLALHGDQENERDAAPFWGPARRAGWTVGLVRSSQARFSDAFGWDDIDLGAAELREHLDTIREAAPEAGAAPVVLGAFSAGAEVALNAWLHDELPADGLILVSPWLAEPGEWVEALGRLEGRALRSVLIVGAEDDEGRESSASLAEAMRTAGLECRLDLVPGTGHDYPEDFAPRLAAALAWIAEAAPRA